MNPVPINLAPILNSDNIGLNRDRIILNLFTRDRITQDMQLLCINLSVEEILLRVNSELSIIAITELRNLILQIIAQILLVNPELNIRPECIIPTLFQNKTLNDITPDISIIYKIYVQNNITNIEIANILQQRNCEKCIRLYRQQINALILIVTWQANMLIYNNINNQVAQLAQELIVLRANNANIANDANIANIQLLYDQAVNQRINMALPFLM